MSMTIDLNDQSLDAKSGSDTPIFNNGKAGRVSVTCSVQKRQPNEADNQPNWKFYMRDANGAEISEGFYYQTDPEKTWALTKQMKSLRHIAKCYLGEDYVFPSYESAIEMLDNIMSQVGGVCNGKAMRVFVNYGTSGNEDKGIKAKPSRFLKLRNFTPFIENASRVTEDNSKLTDSGIEILERPQMDETSGTAVDMSASFGNTGSETTVNAPTEDWKVD